MGEEEPAAVGVTFTVEQLEVMLAMARRAEGAM